MNNHLNDRAIQRLGVRATHGEIRVLLALLHRGQTKLLKLGNIKGREVHQTSFKGFPVTIVYDKPKDRIVTIWKRNL